MGRLVHDLGRFIIGLVEMLLGLRLVLKLLGADPQSTFVSWVYETTQPLLNPFTHAFPAPTVQGQFTLEFTTLFALFIYAFAGYLLSEVLAVIGKRSAR
jgi:uncharacterized protein YggT (Ycf19 family)